MPDTYTTRIDTPGGFQRIVISDPEKKEKTKPEFYLTLSQDAEKAKLHYSPYDHYDEFYYHGELDLTKEADLAKVTSLIAESMQWNISDAVQFEKDLDMYGIQKKFAQKQKEPADVADKKSRKNKNKKNDLVS